MEEQKNNSKSDIAWKILAIISLMAGIYEIIGLLKNDNEPSRKTTLIEGNNISIIDSSNNSVKEYNIGDQLWKVNRKMEKFFDGKKVKFNNRFIW